MFILKPLNCVLNLKISVVNGSVSLVSNKRFFNKLSLFFTNLYLHCLLFESLLRFMVKPPILWTPAQTRHYNVQFALFLGKESPYIFPKLNLLNTGTPLTVPFFFCLHRRLMNKSFSISNCCYQKIVHQHLFMTPTPSSVFQVFT